jgi:hypothetical protein
MPEQQAEALIEQLKQSNRRWKRLAIGSLAAAVLAVAGLVAFAAEQTVRKRAAIAQAEEALRQAEQAIQDRTAAHEEAQQALERAERALYASRLQRAQEALDEGRR